jgi:methyl-accepting chemotaxis protein
MSPEERDELMQFILQSQSSAAERHRDAMQELHEFGLELKEQTKQLKEQTKQLEQHTKQLEQHTQQIDGLAAISRDLVEVARLHSRRLDRLEGLTSL